MLARHSLLPVMAAWTVQSGCCHQACCSREVWVAAAGGVVGAAVAAVGPLRPTSHVPCIPRQPTAPLPPLHGWWDPPPGLEPPSLLTLAPRRHYRPPRLRGGHGEETAVPRAWPRELPRSPPPWGPPQWGQAQLPACRGTMQLGTERWAESGLGCRAGKALPGPGVESGSGACLETQPAVQPPCPTH